MIRIRTADDVLTTPMPGDQFFALLEVSDFNPKTGEVWLVIPDAADTANGVKRYLTGTGVLDDLRSAAAVKTVHIVRVTQLDTAHLGAELADILMDADRENQKNPSG